MKICQSCGMPMQTEEVYGNNADGTKNDEYCVYCFPKGEFVDPNATLEEMIETCVPFMVQQGVSEEKAREELNAVLPGLKRWK